MITFALQNSDEATRAATAALALVRDHVNAALDHSYALQDAQLSLGASIEAGANGRAILRQNRNVANLVADLRAREMAIALRLTQAGVVAERAANLSRKFGSVAALVTSGATVLTDAGMRLAAEAHDGSAFEYLASRGLLADGATTLPDEISSSDRFVVLGVMPLADVQSFLEAAVRAIEAHAALAS